ncbi:MAG TPA: NAD-dependent epimerase/dehydratase family protein [Fimbriimonas sp.]|nr:NAD-dependent epimerase/dehydratase family protein [Fimbriimonas sp.]
MSSKSVLVTGGAGFIGSHVCEALNNAGRRCIALDNLLSGKRSNLVTDGIDLVVGDFTDPELLRKLLPSVDAVVHLAAIPSVVKSIKSPLETHAVNYTGTLSMLEEMRLAGVHRVVYASSAAIYPKNATGRLAEDHIAEPASPYGLDKLTGEHALRIYHTLHGFEATSLRFFNVYGERQAADSAYSGVISLFAKAVTEGRPLKVYGTGEQSRDFIYVRDVAKLIAGLLDRSGCPHTMNVATGRSTTLLELIAAIETATGAKAEVIFEPARPGDILISLADVERLRSFTDWQPTSLSEGLGHLLDSLKS